METFADLIAAWPTLADFAFDHDVDANTAGVWKYRNSIPATHWDQTVSAARSRQIPNITVELLARLARQGKELRREQRAPSEAA